MMKSMDTIISAVEAKSNMSKLVGSSCTNTVIVTLVS